MEFTNRSINSSYRITKSVLYKYTVYFITVNINLLYIWKLCQQSKSCDYFILKYIKSVNQFYIFIYFLNVDSFQYIVIKCHFLAMPFKARSSATIISFFPVYIHIWLGRMIMYYIFKLRLFFSSALFLLFT